MGNKHTNSTQDKEGGIKTENKEGEIKYVELFPKLASTDPKDVFPDEGQSAMATLHKYAKKYEDLTKSYRNMNEYFTHETDIVGNRTPTIGFEEQIYSNADCGLFDSVLMAYNWHFNLRTSPDDWWYCVIRRVAMAIDENSKKEDVRKRFVKHEGKKELAADVGVLNIYDVDYPRFFDSISTLVSLNVKIPEYVDCMTANFTTSSAVKKIVSQITMMTSVQEYFEYRIRLGCGIPAIEMTGTKEDWKKLLSKLKVLRSLLQPMEDKLGLTKKWWALVQKVFTKLLQTYLGKPDKTWWSHILTYNARNGSSIALTNRGPSGYSGWIVEFLEGKVGLEVGQFKSGIVTLPLTIYDPDGMMSDKAALVSGMVGYTLHDGTGNKRVSIQPFQGWSLLLSEVSPFRQRKLNFDKKDE